MSDKVKAMCEQMNYVDALHKHLMNDVDEYLNERKLYESVYSCKFMDKNCGHSVLQRKIIMLRQELLNLSKMLEN